MRLQNWSAPGTSLRTRVVIEALSAVWRPLSSRLPVDPGGIAIGRAMFEFALGRVSPPVPGATFAPVDDRDLDGRCVRGEWVRGPRVRQQPGVVLFFHGSGYAICSTRTHRGLASHISDRSGAPVFSVDYRLAPEARHPAALEDARAGWDWLIARGHAPETVVLAGDSAGGHLALLLTLDLAREGASLPAALVGLSPLIDMDLTAAAVRDRVERDPFAHPALARRVLDLYADEAERRDLNERLVFEDLDAFPPTLIHNGSREMLSADCTELARRMAAAGLPVQHRVWPGQMHVFHALTALLPESHTALDEVAGFIDHHLAVARARTAPVQAGEHGVRTA
ncbi:alpha/beta hydrolase [Gordonia caeni]|uniref:Alpha/beta hydrolase fold-3 domain-containing protein n=1 Tax=Gordonia caeni TaxID=1007097 RepID=A0ABP7NNT0_9ACTN